MLEKTKLYAESWNVAFRKTKPANILENKKTPFEIIKNSWRFWAADPFLFEYNSETYVFAELYDYIACKGTLGYCKLEKSKKPKWKKIISEPYHMSYPYIYEMNGEIYILPESGASNCLYTYKATHFPDKWEKCDIIRENVVYGDTSLFEYQNHTFALSYDVSDNERYRLMLLNLSDKNLDSKIEGNPSIQRPAGRPFYIENRLLRPAQICENDYGEGLIFYEIYFDKEGNYKENAISRIMPNELTYSKNIILNGMHTYNATRNYEVIDIKTRRFNIINLIFRTLNKLK